MPKARPIRTTFSKGELSPLLEGQTTLQAYFEGGQTVENFLILRQGGLDRWPGSRHIAEVKDSSKDTILWPFQFSVDDAYILEVGDLYIRIYKDKARVESGGSPVEVATTFAVADIRSIHLTQSADVLFTFHEGYQQRKLSRVSDTSWSISVQTAVPPPSFEADVNLAELIGIAANTGTSQAVRAKSGIFLAADVGRQIISGAGRATITAYTDTSNVTVDILDNFSQTITAGPATLTSVGTAVASTGHGLAVDNFIVLTSGAQAGQIRRVTVINDADNVTIDAAFSVDQTNESWNKNIGLASGAWTLRLSPQTTLDPNIKAPIGAQVTLVAGAAAFRSADVGKYIYIYGGIVELTTFDTTTQMRGTILSEMGDTADANPSAAPAGAWTLETASWSASNGWPRTGEFFQGRLVQASTTAQPTTWWESRSDDYDNYAVGVTAEDAVEYTMASRQINQIQWLTESDKALFLGTAGSEHRASGSGNDNALIGGDQIPLVDRVATNGCFGIQPIVFRKTIIYIDRSGRKVLALGFDIYADSDADRELSVGSEHITESGVRLGPLAFQIRPDPRLYFVREDGTLVAMTYYPEQKVNAFSRRTTDGTFESVAVIPNTAGGADQVWVIAKRTINGATKRYVELFEPDHEGLTTRNWMSLQTDCAKVLTGITGTSVTGLTHLEAKSVQVIKNGSYIGDYTVASGAITLTEALVASDVVEVGLRYDSDFNSMRPSIEGQVIDGVPRSWDTLWVRLHQSVGGKGNGESFQYEASPLDTKVTFTGDVKVHVQGWDTNGRIRIQQDQPYPLTVLAAFGTLSIGDHD